MSEIPAIEVEHLKVHYPNNRGGATRAVDGVSFSVTRGAFHGIIGESGCGKTTLARTIVGLQKATSGQVHIAGRERGQWQKENRLDFARNVQFVFQDPLGSMSRRQTVRQTLEEPLLIHGLKGRQARIADLLQLVSLPDTVLDRLPRSLSGGQRQRVSIARALALDPGILICDEPLSALDVSIRAQIVNLFMRLRQELDLTIVMVAHDLAVIREMCTSVTVMYLGQVVEEGSAEGVFDAPAHPYSQALLSAVPSADPRIEATRQRKLLEGDPPSPSAIPPGCRFHTRCPVSIAACRTDEPDLRIVGHGGQARCLLADQSVRPEI
uniref:ABC transporter ATP-binding protein n=1 Tax=Pararhizobium sp. IMCC3301 TaxID=3067904 RepID=UPI002741D453|nr:ABC transporter ATP-binding protein [Pararhizobium sp. IMCC3301]